MKVVSAMIVSAILLAGCVAERRSPSIVPTPSPCETSSLHLTAGHSGPAAGTMFLTFTVERATGPPCLIITWPAIEIIGASGRVLARGAPPPNANPRATLLDRSLEFRLGWASWCGPEPLQPIKARVELVTDRPSELAIPDTFRPSGCQGVESIVFIEPGS